MKTNWIGKAGMTSGAVRLSFLILHSSFFILFARAGVDDTISFKGCVSAYGESIADTAQKVKFRLYASETSEEVLWSRLVSVSVDTNLTFYTDLKDNAGDPVPGDTPAATTIRDAVDLCAREQASIWIGWTFGDNVAEAPRVELVKYPWSYIATKAKRIRGDAKCSVVTARKVSINNRESDTNAVYSMKAGYLVKKDDANLKMVTTDRIDLPFILTGGIGGFRDDGKDSSGTSAARVNFDKAVPNDMLVLRLDTFSDADDDKETLKVYSTRIVPCGQSLATDKESFTSTARSSDGGYIQSLGSPTRQ